MGIKNRIKTAYFRGSFNIGGLPGKFLPALRGRELVDRTAVHEAGHALVNHLSSHGGYPTTLTVKPRLMQRFSGTNGLFGAVYETDNSEVLQSRLVMTMAGRAAEKAVFGTANTDDHYKGDIAEAQHLIAKLHGEVTPEREAALIAGAENIAGQVLRDNREKLEELTAMLQQKKTMGTDQIQEVLGQRFSLDGDDVFDAWRPD